MLCTLLWGLAVIAAFLVLVKLIFSDCDLTLAYFERFGLPTSVLRGRVVWITGASSGIGKHLAFDLAKVGCKLVLSARRHAELVQVQQECIKRFSRKEDDILVLPLDVKDFASHKQCVDDVVKKFGVIDVLVNNAGRSQRADWEKVDIEVDKELFNVNVFGLVSLTRAVLPHMFERNRGHIVVTSSVAGKLGVPNSGTYSGTKFALHGYFQGLKLEKLLGTDISVTMVCPGPVVTEVRKNAITDSLDKESYGVDISPDEPGMMATGRCSHLMAVAIANKLGEVWITPHPPLALLYLVQYMPTVSIWLANVMGSKRLQKIRDHTVDKHLNRQKND